MPVPSKKTPPRKPRAPKSADAKPRVTKPRAKRGIRLLLIIDNEPIRKEAIAEYQRLEKEISAARERVEAFESGDLPAYQRWEARQFGPLLTELRTALQTIEEKRAILMEIEEEMYWTGVDPGEAYQQVMKRRESPPQDRSEEEQRGGKSSRKNKPDPDDEDWEGDRLFGDSDLPPDFDIDAFDRMSPREQNKFRVDYTTMAMMYELLSGRRAPDLDVLLEEERIKRGRGAAGASPRGEMPQPEGPGVDRTTDRLKELYRKLVRQLHPDSLKEQTSRERELWHEVQEAYKAKDLERMESVAGRIEIGLGGSALNLPVQILRRMTRDLYHSLHGLKSRVSGVRKHPAWLFRKKAKQLAKLEEKRRRALATELKEAKQALATMQAELDRLAARASAPRRKRAKKRRSEPDFFDDYPF